MLHLGAVSESAYRFILCALRSQTPFNVDSHNHLEYGMSQKNNDKRKKKIQAAEMKILRSTEEYSHLDKKRNEKVRQKLSNNLHKNDKAIAHFETHSPRHSLP